MKMSTKGRYAVMAMIDIATHSDGEPVSLAEIAERQDISQEYLEQLFGKLRKAKLVDSARGPGGGPTRSQAAPPHARRLTRPLETSGPGRVRIAGHFPSATKIPPPHRPAPQATQPRQSFDIGPWRPRILVGSGRVGEN